MWAVEMDVRVAPHRWGKDGWADPPLVPDMAAQPHRVSLRWHKTGTIAFKANSAHVRPARPLQVEVCTSFVLRWQCGVRQRRLERVHASNLTV